MSWEREPETPYPGAMPPPGRPKVRADEPDRRETTIDVIDHIQDTLNRMSGLSVSILSAVDHQTIPNEKIPEETVVSLPRSDIMSKLRDLREQAGNIENVLRETRGLIAP